MFVRQVGKEKIYLKIVIKTWPQILNYSIVSLKSWNNPSLSWNPADFMNITSINILPSRVWKPDVVLYDRLVNVNI